MRKQQSMLSHIIENLGPTGLAELTDAAQEMFPDLAATFGQREPNRRETWLMGLMAGHTWRRKVLNKEFYDAFRVGAMTDTYSESRCRDALNSNLDVCCPGWKMVTEEDGDLYISFPSLDVVRASCEKVFGKISWMKTDEVAMIPIREAEARETAEKEKKEAHDTALLKIVMEKREATLPSEQKVRAKELDANHARVEHSLRDDDASRDVLRDAEAALGEAQVARNEIVYAANARYEEQMRQLAEAEERLATAEV